MSSKPIAEEMAVVTITTMVMKTHKGGVVVKSLIVGDFDVSRAETKVATLVAQAMLGLADKLDAIRTPDGAMYFSPERVTEIGRGNEKA